MTTRRSIALILSPVGLLLISAGGLIIVANFNTTTAVTIASSGGFVNTLLGTVIPLVPVFMPYVALILLLTRHFLLSIMTFIFAAFISPTFITAAAGHGPGKFDVRTRMMASGSVCALCCVWPEMAGSTCGHGFAGPAVLFTGVRPCGGGVGIRRGLWRIAMNSGG
jgi:hypothetical protein